jgi:hypothetical protein
LAEASLTCNEKNSYSGLFIALFGMAGARAEDKADAASQTRQPAKDGQTAKKQPPKPNEKTKTPSVIGAETGVGNPAQYGGINPGVTSGTTATNPNQGSSVGNTGSGR